MKAAPVERIASARCAGSSASRQDRVPRLRFVAATAKQTSQGGSEDLDMRERWPRILLIGTAVAVFVIAVAVLLLWQVEGQDVRKGHCAVIGLRKLAWVLEAHRQDYGAYPDRLALVGAVGPEVCGSLSCVSGADRSEKCRNEVWTSATCSEVAPSGYVDPWGTPYVYHLSQDGSRYSLVSAGPDTRLTTDDDIDGPLPDTRCTERAE